MGSFSGVVLRASGRARIEKYVGFRDFSQVDRYDLYW